MRKTTVAILIVAGIGIVGASMAGVGLYVPVGEIGTDERIDETPTPDTEDVSYEETEEEEEPEPEDDEEEGESVTLEEYIADCSPLDVVGVQRNPDDYLGDYFYVDATIQSVTNKVIYANPIEWDDEEKFFVLEHSYMTLELEDDRPTDVEGVDYFNFVTNDNVRLYGRFVGRYDYESGMITYGFHVGYAELLEDAEVYITSE